MATNRDRYLGYKKNDQQEKIVIFLTSPEKKEQVFDNTCSFYIFRPLNLILGHDLSCISNAGPFIERLRHFHAYGLTLDHDHSIPIDL